MMKTRIIVTKEFRITITRIAITKGFRITITKGFRMMNCYGSCNYTGAVSPVRKGNLDHNR